MAHDRGRLPALDGKADIVDHLPAGTKIGKRQVLYPQLLNRHRWNGPRFLLPYFGFVFPESPEIADVHGMLMELKKAVLLIQQRLRYAEHRHDHHEAVADHHIFQRQNAESHKQNHQIIAHPRTHRIDKQPVYRALEAMLLNHPDSLLRRRDETFEQHLADIGRSQLLGIFRHVMHPPHVVGLTVCFGQLHFIGAALLIFLPGKHKIGQDLEADKKEHGYVQGKGQPGQRKKAKERPEKHFQGIQGHSRAAFQRI